MFVYFLDEFFINKKFSKKLTKFKQEVMKKFSDKISKDVLSEFEKKFLESFDAMQKPFLTNVKEKLRNEFNNYVREKMIIPDNVLLFINIEQADKELANYTAEDVEKLEKETADLEKEIHQNSIILKSLWKEHNEYQGIIEDFKVNKKLIDEYGNGIKDLNYNVDF